jgi:hypothetical protein
MPGTDEDKRAAVNLKISLSSYVITAALGVIAAQAAITTFVLDKRELLTSFIAFSALGFGALIASIYFGGKGITDTYKSGFEGDWKVADPKRQFNLQAILALVGVGLAVVSIFLGTPKADTPRAPADYDKVQTSLIELRKQVNELEAKYMALSGQQKPQVPSGTQQPKNRAKQ